MSRERLKVLVLADSRAFHTARYVGELRRQGCQVVLASMERGSVLHYQLKSRGPIRSLWYTMAATELRSLIKRFQPDVINPHFVSGYGFMAALAQARRFAPVVTTLWGSDVLLVPQKSMFHKRKTAFALNQSDFVLGDSEYLLAAAEKLSPLKGSKVIYWGIEERFLAHHRNSYALGHPLKIIVPRQHEKVYNNEFIVQALSPLIVDGKVQITFPSFGGMAGHFRLISKGLVGDSIQFYDKLPRASFLKFMAGHDVYLSSAISDSSPVSLIEAMALGLIPVAADIPGVREWLNKDTGFPYELYNRRQLYDTIALLVESGNNCEAMRRQNLVHVRTVALFEK
ncbi:MAG TPA: glycosyltransferase, partial [Candidatus Acidoferrum sp.]|nr:glycosyltransferase [Candidatus Acidoferrum sp.]